MGVVPRPLSSAPPTYPPAVPESLPTNPLPHVLLHPHRRVEQLSLAIHAAVAERLERNPEPVLAIARDNLNRWRAHAGYPDAASDAWLALLDGPVHTLLDVLRRDDEHCRDLRQNTPFAGVLPHRERSAIVARFPTQTGATDAAS